MSTPNDTGQRGNKESRLESLVITPGRVEPAYLRQDIACDQDSRIEHSKLATLTVLFVVTAAFGLPLLWRNPRFSSFERVLWAVVILAYTVTIIAGLIWWIRWTIGEAF